MQKKNKESDQQKLARLTMEMNQLLDSKKTLKEISTVLVKQYETLKSTKDRNDFFVTLQYCIKNKVESVLNKKYLDETRRRLEDNNKMLQNLFMI